MSFTPQHLARIPTRAVDGISWIFPPFVSKVTLFKC